MKMEHAVHAPSPGTVTEVNVDEGDQVETGRILVVIEPAPRNPAGPVPTIDAGRTAP
jgi:pyruvate/2-oxoglutarate dehydrogenase complex dihydrolipoamide acyltransferase (E2) component